MSILADIVTALNVVGITSLVGAEGVYTDALPQDKTLPAITISRTALEELMTLGGPEGTKNSVYMFACWAPRKLDAMTLRDAVCTAMEAASIPNRYRVPNDEDPFIEETDQFCERVSYSFWHS